MTLGADGWYDWAIPVPIPGIDRTLAQGGKLISLTRTPVEWQTFHSQEGYVQMQARHRAMAADWVNLNPAQRDEVVRALYASHWEWANPERPTTAWHGTNLRGCGKTGALVQHAPDFARLAHGHAANPHGPGWEAEGLFSQPLDEGQRYVVRRLLGDAEKRHGRKYSRAAGTIREHRQHGPTACPSERYTPLWREMEGASMCEKCDLLVKAVFGSEERMNELLDPQKGIAPLEGRVSRFESNDGPIGQRLTALEERPVSGGGDVPEHRHYNAERTLGVVQRPAREGGGTA